MAINNVMTMVNDSGTGGSSIKPATVPSKLSSVNQAIVAKNYQNYMNSKNNQTPSTQGIISGGGGEGGGGGGFDYSGFLSQLQAQAEAAYNRAKQTLDSTLDSTLGGLLESYNTQKSALQGQYDNSKQTLDSNTNDSLRQAYINKMINARDMNQLLTAQGLTGGASETNLAKMLNNYANNRNSINKTAATNLRELLTSHNTNLADALTNYNDKVATARQNYANYLAQLEQNRASMATNAMLSMFRLLG